jgi:hypothetical protein
MNGSGPSTAACGPDVAVAVGGVPVVAAGVAVGGVDALLHATPTAASPAANTPNRISDFWRSRPCLMLLLLLLPVIFRIGQGSCDGVRYCIPLARSPCPLVPKDEKKDCTSVFRACFGRVNALLPNGDAA